MNPLLNKIGSSIFTLSGMLLIIASFLLYSGPTTAVEDSSQRQITTLSDMDINSIERVILFYITNRSAQSVVVKKITIDGLVYLDHEKIIKPYDLSSIVGGIWAHSLEEDDLSYSFMVIDKEVENFEMLVKEAEKDRIYSYELITSNEVAQEFDVRIGDDSFISPLKSVTMFDDGAEKLDRELERIYTANN